MENNDLPPTNIVSILEAAFDNLWIEALTGDANVNDVYISDSCKREFIANVAKDIKTLQDAGIKIDTEIK